MRRASSESIILKQIPRFAQGDNRGTQDDNSSSGSIPDVDGLLEQCLEVLEREHVRPVAGRVGRIGMRLEEQPFSARPESCENERRNELASAATRSALAFTRLLHAMRR